VSDFQHYDKVNASTRSLLDSLLDSESTRSLLSVSRRSLFAGA